jgi:hypothetical protein
VEFHKRESNHGEVSIYKRESLTSNNSDAHNTDQYKLTEADIEITLEMWNQHVIFKTATEY